MPSWLRKPKWPRKGGVANDSQPAKPKHGSDTNATHASIASGTSSTVLRQTFILDEDVSRVAQTSPALTGAESICLAASQTHPKKVAPGASTLTERLWDEAYDDLKRDDSTLVTAYETVLSRELSEIAVNNGTSDCQESSICQADHIMRRSQMGRLVHAGLTKTEKQAKFKQGIGQAMQVVLSAKDLVSSAVQAMPQAALAWTGFCFALQILLNPILETKANRDGVVYVISRLNWYGNLSDLLLQENTVDNRHLAGLRSDLEKQIVYLYKALLAFQMKSVCSYYRNQGLIFLQDTIKLGDWDGNLKGIKEAENAVRLHSNEYNTQNVILYLKQLLDTAENQEVFLLHNIHQVLQEQASVQLKKEDQQCLKDLRLTDPRDDMSRIEQTKGGLLHECYKWILDNPEFHQWRNNEHNRLLWIKGDPGKGKTMLLIGIIKELSQHKQKLTPNTGLLFYFFCQATDARLNNATVVLRGLIYLLLVQKPQLISYVREKYDYVGQLLFEDMNVFCYFSEILKRMLHDPSSSGAYLIVDALDECETDLTHLLGFITKNAAASEHAKWIVTSRNTFNVERDLRLNDTRMKSLELNSAQVSLAVEKYIDYNVPKLEPLGYDEVIQRKVRDRMYRNANGTFLWVVLVFNELQEVPSGDILRVLDEIPTDLKLLYDRMIQQIQASKNSDRCRLVLSTVTLAYRPLHLLELGIVSGLSGNTQHIKMIVKTCGSFLTVRQDHVYLIHQSAQEYLNADRLGAVFSFGRGNIQSDILSRSLHSMAETLRKDIYNLRHPGTLINEIGPINTGPLGHLQYSCVYWVQHFRNSEIQDFDKLLDFFRLHFLSWLEALGWMGKISEGILAMTSLESYIPVNKNLDLHAFLHDAKRFVLYNRSMIEQAPLQIYCSALVFSPKKSIVRQQFQESIPDWIQRKPKVPDDWRTTTLQTLEGHSDSVTSVAFSPNSKLVVSGSDDMTIQLWDTSTGKRLCTLQGHVGYVTSVAFSPDSKLVVSGSDDNKIRLWDTDTGTTLQTFEGHWIGVSSVAFSPDNKWIVSGSDRAVQLRDAKTGVLQYTLQEHSKSISSVAFSPDSKQVVSGSDDTTIQLWDIDTGERLQTFHGHSGGISSVAFSPVGKHIVSGSSDKTMRLWDINTGKTLQIFEGHSGGISSVCFSLDSRQVVSGSDDDTARLWDTGAGKTLRILKGHSNCVTSVAFSLNGKLIVSGSDDKTIRLWDINTEAVPLSLEGHRDIISSVAFSPDNKWIVSGSNNGTVWLWDTSTRALQYIFKGHLESVNSVAFSLDSTQILSGSNDKTIRLWDINTRETLHTFKGYLGGVSSVDFSSDCSQVVSRSDDKRAQFWDINTGERTTAQHRSRNDSGLRRHPRQPGKRSSRPINGRINSVAFSLDGRKTVSCLNEETIRLVDLSTDKTPHTLKGHWGSIISTAFSPNNKLVVSGSRDHTVRLWSTNGRLLQIFKGHLDWVTSVAFSSDSKMVVSGSADETVRLWNVDVGAALARPELFKGY